MFSLIIGTLNRVESIKSCLESIHNQTIDDYEIIIVDQSNDNETENYIKSLSSDKIKYIHVSYKGLSKARNQALKMASGDFFCLLDDDAYYEKHYLEIAYQNIREKRILSGYIFNTIKKDDFVSYKRKLDGKSLPVREIMRTCPSAALVLPMNLIEDIGMFDEEFGVGAIYGSGEETDYLLRSLQKGYEVIYINGLKLMHPIPISKHYDGVININKEVTYFEGLGALYKKHFLLGKNKRLCICYCELWLKLLIKILLPFRYDTKSTIKYLKGLKYGIDNYGKEKNNTSDGDLSK